MANLAQQKLFKQVYNAKTQPSFMKQKDYLIYSKEADVSSLCAHVRSFGVHVRFFDVHIFLNSQLHAIYGYNVTGLKYYPATNDKKTCSFQSLF